MALRSPLLPLGLSTKIQAGYKSPLPVFICAVPAEPEVLDKNRGGQPEEQFVPRPKIPAPKLEPFNLIVEEEELLREALSTGKATVGDVTLEFDSVPVKPEQPIARFAPTLDAIKDDVEREIAELIRAQVLADYQQALVAYEEDLRKFEEEFLMFLMLLE